MTKYIVEILKQFGIYIEDFSIQYHSDEDTGDLWITLHPKKKWKDYPPGLERINALQEEVYGKYTIYWNEDNCYLNIVGIVEISAKGNQLFPIPTTKNPQYFEQDYILKLWQENREQVEL